MRRRYTATGAVLALGAVVGTGIATQEEGAAAAGKPVNAQRAGFDGYQLVKLPNANVPAFTRRTVWCPGGKRAVGGGGEAQGNGAILVGSFPTDDGRGWIALGRQDGFSTVGISVYAICANAT
ncbi:hypothetical protein [Actinomadura sp. HBU206391]|uniref:hypothetical protein n=1 Tax=Actinomadura sp. HBU206391 TaxID=2731692 RepID=UPI0016505625|nr:hypothetical protein [Actinomadura sp. HBU206391]MBC6458515.1 hypothetical protein [Actinomadura sp. HBU206391]